MPDSALVYCAGGGIGDSLMASVVARALRRRFRKVDALTLPGHASTLERTPDLDGVFVDDNGSERALAKSVAAARYDAVITTWATQRTARVPHLARVPVRVGQSRRLYSWRFTHRVKVRSEDGDVTSHWSQILLDYARALQCDAADAVPSVRPTQGDLEQAQSVLRDFHCENDAFVIVHPANAIASRRDTWPLQGWSALAAAVQRRFAIRVILSGSDDDRGIAQRIAGESGTLCAAGRLSMGGFAALAQRARLFIGITTGTMHVAAAVGAATVGIFPFQTDTPERWAPLGKRTAIVRASYPCRRGERKETCPDYACVANLDVPRILAASQSLMEWE